MGSSTKYGWTMSAWTNMKSGDRMCSMLRSDPVSRLSTQMTRWPRRRSSSHRCEPKNPAPPVTRQVDMSRLDYGSRAGDLADGGPFPAHRLALASLAQVALADRGVQGPGSRAGALRQPGLPQPPQDDGAAPAARTARAAALLDLDVELRHRRRLGGYGHARTRLRGRAQRAGRSRVRRAPAVRRDRRALRRRDAAAAGGVLLRAGARGAQPRDDDGPVPPGLGRRRRHPGDRRAALGFP